MNQTEWHMIMPAGNEELVAFGQKPADFDPSGFSGVHSRFMLAVFDEACGMPVALFVAADSLLTSDESRFLAIGNPDDPSTEFAMICRPNSGWHVVCISAFDMPAFTGEAVSEALAQVLTGRSWVEDKRKKWAPTWRWVDAEGQPSSAELGRRCVPPVGETEADAHPLWLSKVLGQFPENVNAMGLLPITWVEAAMERTLETGPDSPSELGVDVGAGGDASTTAHRLGGRVRILSEDHNPNTMQTTGKVVTERRLAHATVVKVDKIGIGAGITDRGQELGEPFIGINVGLAAICICATLKDQDAAPPRVGTHYDDCNVTRFANLKAQNWWELREAFEAGLVDLDPLDEATAAELVSLRYKRNSKGQIQIESKEEAKRRGIPSPNRAEAVMLAWSPAPTSEEGLSGGLVW